MSISKYVSDASWSITSIDLSNRPSPQEWVSLGLLAEVFDIVWHKWGELIITSAFRSLLVNAELRRRGYPAAKYSQHCAGEAVDFYPSHSPIEDIYTWIATQPDFSGFGQLIYYPQAKRPFLHLSIERPGRRPRNQVLVHVNGKYRSGDDVSVVVFREEEEGEISA